MIRDGRDEQLEGHAFISYVREDAAQVDRIQRAFEAHSIPVWRDTADLWPGEDWRAKIRQAITDDALVFIACFSRNSVGRRKSYQREEFALAIDQMRLRNPDEPWLIPVRFDDCDIPHYDIGAGRSLASIQCADLYGARSYEATSRLAAAVLRILGRNPRGSSPSPNKSAVQSFNERALVPADSTATVGLYVDLENLLYNKPSNISYAELARRLITHASGLGRLEKAWVITSRNIGGDCKSAEYEFRNTGFLISSEPASFQGSHQGHIRNASDVMLTSIILYEAAGLRLNRVVIVSGDGDLLVPVSRLLEENVTVRLVAARESFNNAWKRLAETHRSLAMAAGKSPDDANFDIVMLEDLISK